MSNCLGRQTSVHHTCYGRCLPVFHHESSQPMLQRLQRWLLLGYNQRCQSAHGDTSCHTTHRESTPRTPSSSAVQSIPRHVPASFTAFAAPKRAASDCRVASGSTSEPEPTIDTRWRRARDFFFASLPCGEDAAASLDCGADEAVVESTPVPTTAAPPLAVVPGAAPPDAALDVVCPAPLPPPTPAAPPPSPDTFWS